MKIEAMRIGDYDEVVDLWARTDGVTVGLGDDRENIRRYLRRNRGLSLVARERGRIIGAVLCGHDGRRGFLWHLAVEADSRGRGIGRALVERCLGGLARAGIRRCFIMVFAHNAGGRRFWRKAGWKAARDVDLMLIDRPEK